MRIGPAESWEGRSVSDRLVLIIDTVATQRTPIGLTRLSTLTGIAKSTVHRLASDLVRHGFLHQEDAGGYRLGLHLFELGQRVTTSRHLRNAALPYLADLLTASREVVQLGVIDGDDIVCLEKLSNPHSVQLFSAVGSRVSADRCALGKVVLAFDERSRIASESAAVVMSGGSATGARVGTLEFDTIRRQGVAYDCGDGEDGIACVAAPIFDQAGRAFAAVSVAGPARELQIVRVATAVRTAAAGIGATLSSSGSGHPVRR